MELPSHGAAAFAFFPMNNLPPGPRVLIADDQREVREALRLLLKGEGFVTEVAASPAEILQAVTTRDFDAVLMDLNYTRDTTSGQEGLELLNRIQTLDGTLPVIVSSQSQ